MIGSIQLALIFATEAHAGQRRKYTSEPYIVHPISVYNIVYSAIGRDAYEYSDDLLCGCLLHDVIEDSNISLNAITRSFGINVGEIVSYCTKLPSAGLPRKERARFNNEFYAKGNYESQSIKVADMIDNLPSIKQYDPEFYKIYRQEKLDLLSRLTKANSNLIKIAAQILEG